MNYVFDDHPDHKGYVSIGGRCLDSENIYLFQTPGIEQPEDTEIETWSFIIEHEHIHAILHKFGIPLSKIEITKEGEREV